MTRNLDLEPLTGRAYGRQVADRRIQGGFGLGPGVQSPAALGGAFVEYATSLPGWRPRLAPVIHEAGRPGTLAA